MKYLMLVCEGLADEPIEELNSRTPLEIAKTPFMDLLAKKGRLGNASFVPHSMPLRSEVASLSLLGFKPKELYTGIAPLETIAKGIPQSDREIVFRFDWVTVSDDTVVDAAVGDISDKEAMLLVEAIRKKALPAQMGLYPLGGHKNILVVKDPDLACDLDELECTEPGRIQGQKFEKHLPKGKSAAVLTQLMDKTREILEHHEINRVRIDLKENPANMLWPWGQGRTPKIPSFKQTHGLEGAIISEEDALLGLAKALGMAPVDNLERGLEQRDFVFCYKSFFSNPKNPKELKTKIRRIEDFDSSVVGAALKAVDRLDGEYRIFIGTGLEESLTQKMPLHGHVPFLIQGKGVERVETAVVLNEKTASQSQLIFDDGWNLMEYFLT